MREKDGSFCFCFVFCRNLSRLGQYEKSAAYLFRGHIILDSPYADISQTIWTELFLCSLSAYDTE